MDARLAAAFDQLLATFREFRVEGRPETGFNEPDINQVRAAFQRLKTEMARVYLAPDGQTGGELPPLSVLNQVIALESALNTVAASAVNLPDLVSALGSWLTQPVAQSIIDAESYAPDFLNAFQLSDPAAINARIDDVFLRRLGPRIRFVDELTGWTSDTNAAPGAGAAAQAPWAFADHPVFGGVAQVVDPNGQAVALATSDVINFQIGERVSLDLRWNWTGGGSGTRIATAYLVPVDPVTGRTTAPVIAAAAIRTDADMVFSETLSAESDGTHRGLRLFYLLTDFVGTGDLNILEPIFRRESVAVQVVGTPVTPPNPGAAWVWTDLPNTSAPLPVPLGQSFTIDFRSYGSDADTPVENQVFSVVSSGAEVTVDGLEGSIVSLTVADAGLAEVTIRASDGTNEVDATFVLDAQTQFPQMAFGPSPNRVFTVGVDPGDFDWKQLIEPASVRAAATVSVDNDVPGRTLGGDGVETGPPSLSGAYPQTFTASLPDGQSKTLSVVTYHNVPPQTVMGGGGGGGGSWELR